MSKKIPECRHQKIEKPGVFQKGCSEVGLAGQRELISLKMKTNSSHLGEVKGNTCKSNNGVINEFHRSEMNL